MSEPSDKRWYQALPPKLAAVVVFLVAFTTLLGNLFELNEKRQTTQPTATPAVPQPLPATPSVPVVQPMAPTTPAAPVIQRVNLRLERIAVEHDGSPGTTDWRFTVTADGQPLFAFGQDGLDDTGGRNISMPEHVQGTLRLKPGQIVALQVQGWRQSRLRAASDAPHAIGEGQLSAIGDLAPIKVAAADVHGGAFTFYFVADETKADPAD